MTKTQVIINSLRDQIQSNRVSQNDMDASSWGYEEGVLITGNDAQFIVDILVALETDKELPPTATHHKLNGTIAEDEIMGQSITQPEWHLDPLDLPATKRDVMVSVEAALVRLELRLQTIEKKMP